MLYVCYILRAVYQNINFITIIFVLYPQKFSIEELIINFFVPEHSLHSRAFPAAIVKEEG